MYIIYIYIYAYQLYNMVYNTRMKKKWNNECVSIIIIFRKKYVKLSRKSVRPNNICICNVYMVAAGVVLL